MNEIITEGMVELAIARALFEQAHFLDRPGNERHGVWHFTDWTQLSDSQRETWRVKARRLLSWVRDVEGVKLEASRTGGDGDDDKPDFDLPSAEGTGF